MELSIDGFNFMTFNVCAVKKNKVFVLCGI